MQFILISIPAFILLFYFSYLSYRDFNILGIIFSEEDSNRKEVKDIIRKEKRRQIFIYFILIIFSFLLKIKKFTDLFFFVLLFSYLIASYFSLKYTRNSLEKFKKRENISYKVDKIKIDMNKVREIELGGESKKYIYFLWLLSFIPLIISIISRNYKFLAINIALPIIYLIFPLFYNSFLENIRIPINKDFEKRVEYIKICEKNNSYMYILSSLICILLTDILMILLQFNIYRPILYILTVGISLILIFFIYRYFSKKNKEAIKLLGEDISFIEDDWTIKWGFPYNKKDPRLFVPKKIGFGISINMGHPIGRIIGIITLGILMISILLIFLLIFSQYKFVLDDNSIDISIPMYSKSIEYDDIENINYEISNLNILQNQRINGYGGDSRSYGYFYIENYGNVNLYIYNYNESHIDIYEKNGDITIINLESEKETEDFYEKIIKMMKK